MIKDIFTSLLSITKGIHKDSTTERAYTELNKKLKINASYKTTPLFSINFTERDLGSKRKYYKKYTLKVTYQHEISALFQL